MTKTKVEKQFQELESLALKWREFSREANGWNTTEYSGLSEKVRCYFADRSDHTDVGFYFNRNHAISFAFFNPAHIEFKSGGLGRLQEYIDTFTALLEKTKAEHDQIDAKALEAHKKARIEVLKRELGELEEPTNT